MTNPRQLRHLRDKKVAIHQNEAHKLAASHALVCYRSDVVYSFIPKNACSTLRLSLAIANGAIVDETDWTWIHPNNGAFSATFRDLATAKFTFTVLRCPWSRLSSVFLDKIVSRTPEYFKIFRLEDDAIDPWTFTFRDFVGFVGHHHLRADIHWRPQTDFLVYEDYDAWYAFEDFSAAVQDIEARAGFEVVDARAHTRHGTEQFNKRSEHCYVDVPIAEIEAMKRQGDIPDHAALYDDTLAARVGSMYAADIVQYCERFGPSGLTFNPSGLDLAVSAQFRTAMPGNMQGMRA
jgi:hypothetical protein